MPSFFIFEKLPYPVLLEILEKLNAKSLTTVAQVSTFFKKAANEPVLWKNLYEKDFKMPLLLKDASNKEQYKEKYAEEFYKEWRSKYSIH